MSIFFTDVREVATPRGPRYSGRSIVRGRGSLVERIRYSSPLRVHAADAFELARSRTIHHNLWHDGSPDAVRIASQHDARDCHERGLCSVCEQPGPESELDASGRCRGCQP